MLQIQRIKLPTQFLNLVKVDHDDTITIVCFHLKGIYIRHVNSQIERTYRVAIMDRSQRIRVETRLRIANTMPIEIVAVRLFLGRSFHAIMDR